MIRPVQSPETQQLSAPSASGDASTGKTFAAMHEAALTRSKDALPAAPPTATPQEGETWSPVKGQSGMAQVISGPRQGQFINLLRGHRHGQAFSVDHRGGKTVHVYGSGTHQEVVDPASEGRSARRHHAHPADRPPKGEVWEPVAGTPNYADILGGKRNGLYVNTSGGVREGMAFQIVNRGGKTFHVYGQGKDKLLVEVHTPATPRHAPPLAAHVGAAPARQSGGSSTGGTAAPPKP